MLPFWPADIEGKGHAWFFDGFALYVGSGGRNSPCDSKWNKGLPMLLHHLDPFSELLIIYPPHSCECVGCWQSVVDMLSWNCPWLKAHALSMPSWGAVQTDQLMIQEYKSSAFVLHANIFLRVYFANNWTWGKFSSCFQAFEDANNWSILIYPPQLHLSQWLPTLPSH